MNLINLIKRTCYILFAWMQYMAAGFYPQIEEEGFSFFANRLYKPYSAPWDRLRLEREWNDYSALQESEYF